MQVISQTALPGLTRTHLLKTQIYLAVTSLSLTRTALPVGSLSISDTSMCYHSYQRKHTQTTINAITILKCIRETNKVSWLHERNQAAAERQGFIMHATPVKLMEISVNIQSRRQRCSCLFPFNIEYCYY